ncbi:hypothetical protein Tco_0413937, partial [Tanacetum coccineum]
LAKEITDMKEVFNQMETGVAKCSIERKYFDIEKKELFIENDRLLEHIICQDVMCIPMHTDVVYNCVVHANDNRLVYAEMEQSYIDEYSRVLELETELSKKKNMVEKLRRKNTTISNLKGHIATLKAKSVSHCASPVNNFNVIAPGMFKLDLEPLSPLLKKNRDAHLDYLKETKKNTDILHDIVKEARDLSPPDNNLGHACHYVQHIQELLVYVGATCPDSKTESKKVVGAKPMNKQKKVRFGEPKKSTSNTSKQSDSQNSKITNQPLLTSTGVKCSTSASESKPSSNTKK